MRPNAAAIIVATLGGVLTLSSAPFADQSCDCSTCAADYSYALSPCCQELGDYIEVGFVPVGGGGNRDSIDQYGRYPQDWLTSGRLHLGDNYYYQSSRFEARWQDISTVDGRAWARLALWPVTLEGNSSIISGRAWNAFAEEPRLISQRTAMDRLILRVHEGGAENWQLGYEQLEIQRSLESELKDLSVKRLALQHNFDLGCSVHGQIRQTGTAFDAPRIGIDNAEVDTTLLKLDAEFEEDVSAYGRFSYSLYNYEGLPDNSFDGHDYSVGLRYRPNCYWEWNAEYRAKGYPDANTVSSHVDEMNEYGLVARYASGSGDVFEAGYKRRNLNYVKLNMQDAAVFPLLRTNSVVTPNQVASALSLLKPQYDSQWIDLRTQLSDDLRFTSRVDYSVGDNPGSELTVAHSPGLLFDKRLSLTHGLAYALDDCSELAITLYDQESKNSDRNNSFSQHYLEGSWSRSIVPGGSLGLAYRKSDASLDVSGLADEYTTSDSTYLATYSQDKDDFDYSLNFSVSDGSGAEEYTQTGAGATLKLKNDVPLGFTIDWYDRSYSNFPAFDTEELTLAVNYQFKLD